MSDSESDDSGDNLGFFNPDLFTSNVELERDAFTFDDLRVELQFIHNSNQFVDRFVSRVVWPSAQEMCTFFKAHPEEIVGKRVLELGSGTGLCGIAVGLLGAGYVALTDNNDEAVALLAENAKLNKLGEKCTSHTHMWGDTESADKLIEAVGGKFDVVIGTDVVYEPECVNPLLTSARHFLKNGDSKFFLANHTVRYGGLEKYVKQEAVELGLDETVMPSIVGEDGRIDFSIFCKGSDSSAELSTAKPAALTSEAEREGST